MKFRKIGVMISCLIVLAFALAGVDYVSTVIHELSHKSDLAPYTSYDGSICILSYNENVSWSERITGYYLYTLDNETPPNFLRNTEIKAYSKDGVFTILFLICCIFLIFNLDYREKRGGDIYG